MSILLERITYLYDLLKKHGVIKEITNKSYDFYDEPKPFTYELFFSDKVQTGLKNSDFILNIDGISSSGISYFSKELALLKCLTEAIERLCLCSFLEENTYIKEFSKLKLKAIDPTLFNKEKGIKNKKIGWMKGFQLSPDLTQEEVLVPAQLTHIYYHKHQKHNEPFLSSHISTGAAAGFEYEDTLLRGIYEVIERDSMMCMYLAQIPVPHISLQTINSSDITLILDKLHQYKITPTIFYIANDIGIPTYVSILVDNTDNGPKVTVGTKSSLHRENGILGSLEEALLSRIYTRKVMRTYSEHTENLKPEKLTSVPKRALYWSRKQAVEYLHFLFSKSQSISFSQTVDISDDMRPKEELKYVLQQLYAHKYTVYGADITLPIIKRTQKVRAYKVIIPGLQPLYLDERRREFIITRLHVFASFYNKIFQNINEIPHPYL